MIEKLLGVLAWPIAVLAFGVVFLFLFRGQIAALISRIQSASLGKDRTISFGQATIDREGPKLLIEAKPPAVPPGSRVQVKWENSGNLFWLGHDLMWTQQMALRGAPKDRIVHGLKQSDYHLTHLNLGDSEPGQYLKELLRVARDSGPADWDNNRRNQFASNVGRVIGEVALLAKAHQPDFEKDVT